MRLNTSVLTRSHEHATKAALLLAALALASCEHADPRQELEIVSRETYWVIESSVGQTHYLAPAVRIEVRNKGMRVLRAVEATASFRRKGEEQIAWGSAWARLKPAGGKLAPREVVTVVLTSDSRYSSQGSPEQMLDHKLFKDALVHVYLRISGSAWIQMAQVDVERRIGSRSVDAFVTGAPPGLPSPPR